MLEKDEIIMLDNKEYFVIDSIMKEQNNYIMIGEIKDEEVTNNIKIMHYNMDTEEVTNIDDPTLLYSLVSMFYERN